MLILDNICLKLILMYKNIFSPYTGSVCRFQPTCSTYMYEAILKYGTIRGLLLGIKRLFRCTPVKSGGFDPVP
ncbi:MAG: membrane protein insertion efficiency factor YidD [SAR202 cluster bacterium]|nr:membrane protein insertion efficiency factor YidD [SAR202 cluster bacterium]|tara:strand:+ start:35311 stop:35529 length:219 start_codon:yes stop_codon:yes gene_type:complete